MSDNKLARFLIAASALLLSCLPYGYAFLHREDRIYLWLGFNFDDACVYLSWLHQAAFSSHPFRTDNLFTTEPQTGMSVNPLFLLLGLVGRCTHLSPLFLFHASRLFFGAALFWRLGKLLATLDIPKRASLLIFAAVAFSSGLGWIPGFWERDGIASPIDRWQPEAVTFLSLLLNPLFLASMCLQITTFDLLLRGERNGSRRTALLAGIGAALLTLIHTYDLISLGVVWALYLICRLAAKPAPLQRSGLLKTTALASLVVLPALGWMGLQLRFNALFSARAAVETRTPALLWIVLGYGFTLGLAVLPFLEFSKERKRTAQKTPVQKVQENSLPFESTLLPKETLIFLGTWGAGQILSAYLPVSFQRKMLQGTHLPLSILAGLGILLLLERWKTTRFTFSLASVGIVSLLSLSNGRFLLREMANSDANLVQTGLHRAYLSEPEGKAVEWLQTQVAPDSPDASVQALPWLALISDPVSGKRRIGVKDMTLPVLIPALTGLKTYCAHFGETPNFGEKLGRLSRYTSGRMAALESTKFRREMRTSYLLFTQSPSAAGPDAEIAAEAEAAFRSALSGQRQYPELYGVNLIKNVR